MDLEGNHLWVNAKACSDRKKLSSAGFKPSQFERTDFDSVVVTTWLRPVRWIPKETTYEWMPRHVLIGKNCRRQVSNLRSPRETDFDSVVVTTWLRPVRGTAKETTYEWMPRHVLIGKNCRRQVSNLRSPRETDLDSVVVTTWLRPVGWIQKETTCE
jgi:hypothetical protein